MDPMYAGATAGVVSIIDQVSKLDWAFILSGVGIAEVVLGNIERKGVSKKRSWLFPLVLGLFIGAVNHIALAGDALSGISYIAGAIKSSLTYGGWVAFSYYFTLRPIKYAGDWLKRRSQGAK